MVISAPLGIENVSGTEALAPSGSAAVELTSEKNEAEE